MVTAPVIKGLVPLTLGHAPTGLSDAHSRIIICTGQSDCTLSCRILPALQMPPRAVELLVVYSCFTPHLKGSPPRPSLLGLRRTLFSSLHHSPSAAQLSGACASVSGLAVLSHSPLTAQTGETETQSIESWGLNKRLVPSPWCPVC